jgi:hypothetical protein
MKTSAVVLAPCLVFLSNTVLSAAEASWEEQQAQRAVQHELKLLDNEIRKAGQEALEEQSQADSETRNAVQAAEAAGRDPVTGESPRGRIEVLFRLHGENSRRIQRELSAKRRTLEDRMGQLYKEEKDRRAADNPQPDGGNRGESAYPMGVQGGPEAKQEWTDKLVKNMHLVENEMSEARREANRETGLADNEFKKAIRAANTTGQHVIRTSEGPRNLDQKLLGASRLHDERVERIKQDLKAKLKLLADKREQIGEDARMEMDRIMLEEKVQRERLWSEKVEREKKLEKDKQNRKIGKQKEKGADNQGELAAAPSGERGKTDGTRNDSQPDPTAEADPKTNEPVLLSLWEALKRGLENRAAEEEERQKEASRKTLREDGGKE